MKCKNLTKAGVSNPLTLSYFKYIAFSGDFSGVSIEIRKERFELSDSHR